MVPNRIVPRLKGQWSACNAANTTEVRVAELCPTLCDPMDYRIHGILQARIQEWAAFPFSRVSSQPRDWTQVSGTTGGFFTSWVTREAQEYWSGQPFPSPGDHRTAVSCIAGGFFTNWATRQALIFVCLLLTHLYSDFSRHTWSGSTVLDSVGWCAASPFLTSSFFLNGRCLLPLPTSLLYSKSHLRAPSCQSQHTHHPDQLVHGALLESLQKLSF